MKKSKRTLGLPGGSVVKNPSANAGDADSIPGLGRSPGEQSGNPLQYSSLENSKNRGAGQAPQSRKRVGHALATKTTTKQQKKTPLERTGGAESG